MQTRIILKFGLILLLVITISVFSFRAVRALVLPVEAGLGQTCSTTVSCESKFFCSGGKCVQCENDGRISTRDALDAAESQVNVLMARSRGGGL